MRAYRKHFSRDVEKEISYFEVSGISEELPEAEIVEAAGLKWVAKNLGAKDEWPYGHVYTYEEAIANCPEGCRLPTAEEYERLLQESQWGVDDMHLISIYRDRDDSGMLLFPLGGYRAKKTMPEPCSIEERSVDRFGIKGAYWTSTPSPDAPKGTSHLYICFSDAGPDELSSDSHGMGEEFGALVKYVLIS